MNKKLKNVSTEEIISITETFLKEHPQTEMVYPEPAILGVGDKLYVITSDHHLVLTCTKHSAPDMKKEVSGDLSMKEIILINMAYIMENIRDNMESISTMNRGMLSLMQISGLLIDENGVLSKKK
jgi:hypothetical protein